MFKYKLSYWERETFFSGIDVAIIGSGIVGLTAALHLKTIRPELRVAVFERGALPTGASTRNAGFACFGSMTELLDDMHHMTEDEVLAVVEKRWRGLQRLRTLVGDEHMEFSMSGGYEMFTDDEEQTFQQCEALMPDFNRKIGAITGHPQVYKVASEQIHSFGFRGVRHLILNQAEGQVHTGKMMARLIRLAHDNNIALFNGIPIESIEDDRSGVSIQTAYGWEVRAAKVIVAVNGFAQSLLPGLPVAPARNQVLITHPIPGLKVKGCFHYDRGFYYFRNVGDRILLGGGRNLAQEEEQTENFGANQMIRSALIQLLRRVISPGVPLDAEHWWSGILGLGPEKKPIVQHTSPNVVAAVRLNGMGVAIGSLVGMDGAELAVG